MIKMIKKLNNKEYKYDFKRTICIYILLFFISSFIGYLYEVIYYLIDDNELVNRGFLYGPYLPVYGFGAIFMIVLLKKFKKNPILVFLLSMLVTGLLEYLTGYGLYQIYHKKWWDYTGLFLNINGYVCFRSVLTFGIGGILLIYILEPLVCKLTNNISNKKYTIISVSLILILLIDFIFALIFRNN